MLWDSCGKPGSAEHLITGSGPQGTPFRIRQPSDLHYFAEVPQVDSTTLLGARLTKTSFQVVEQRRTKAAGAFGSTQMHYSTQR